MLGTVKVPPKGIDQDRTSPVWPDVRSSEGRETMASWSGKSCVLHLTTVVVLVVLLIPVGLANTVPAKTGPRAAGAHDYGSTPGQVNFYPNGYPLKKSVMYTFNLSISFEWDLSASEKTDYQNRARNFNARLYDGTDGQMAVEKLDFWNNQAHWDVADFRFYHRSDRAYTYRGGIDMDGGHIFVYTNDDGKVMQHEFGHYGLYLPDEYTDAHGAFCSCTQGTTYNTDEWCCKNNHCTYDWSFCHDQGHGEALSCWEQIHNAYPNVTTKNPPSAGPYDEPEPILDWHDKLDFATVDANMTIFPAKPSSGDLVNVNVTFSNYDYSIDGSQKFVLYDKDPAMGGHLLAAQNFNVRDLPVFTIPFQINVVEGVNTFWVMADPNNTVAETNENNNVAKGQVYVNHRPTISPLMPKLFSGWEDQPLKIDLTPYECDIEDGNASLVWNVSNIDKTKIIDMKADYANDEFTFTPLLYWHGTTRIDLRLSDSVGATAKANVELEFKWVNHLPTVTEFSIDSHSTLRGGAANLVLRGKDIEDKENGLTPDIEYKAPTTDWTSLSASYDSGFRAVLQTDSASKLGNYSFRAMLTDADTGESAWAYINDTFWVQNNLPQMLGIAWSNESILRTSTSTVRFTAQDIEDTPDLLIWQVRLQGPDGNWTTYDEPVTYVSGHSEVTLVTDTKSELGVYHVSARASDKDGNWTDWLDDQDGLIVENNPPEIFYIKADAKEVYRTNTVQVRAMGKDVEQSGGQLKVEFQYSYGNAWLTDYLSQPTYDSAKGEWIVGFTPPAGADPGGVTFRARFTDADGDATEWANSDYVQVKNNPPVCKMDGQIKGQTGDQLKFHGSNSTDVEGQVTYYWVFGDGQVSTDANPVHKYTSAKTYTVTLTVKDPNGLTDSKSMSVTIDKKPEPVIPFTPTGSGSGASSFLLLGILLAVIVVVILVVAAIYMSRRKKRRAQALPPVGAAPRTAPGAPSLLYEEFDNADKNGPGAMAPEVKDTPKAVEPPGPPKAPEVKETPKVEAPPPPGPPPPGPPK